MTTEQLAAIRARLATYLAATAHGAATTGALLQLREHLVREDLPAALDALEAARRPHKRPETTAASDSQAREEQPW